MKSILLAYSGGLDTSVAVKWLQEVYHTDVHCLVVDVGQEEDLGQIGERARANGAKSVITIDAREEFAKHYIFEMLQGHPAYEAHYLLGSAIARPLIAKYHFLEGKKLNIDALAHGATGKGNDQFRFELGLASLGSKFPVIAPWREWDFGSRADLIEYASRNGVKLEGGTSSKKPMSMDRNLVHTSYEGEQLEDPAKLPPYHAFDRICELEDAPQNGDRVTISFKGGVPTAIDRKSGTAMEIMQSINAIGARHGIGRTDHIESRLLGMKSRNIYETPGLTILYAAHRAAEAMCLDKEVLYLKEDLMPRYARQIYDGLWFSPERQMLQAALNAPASYVNADITVLLKKGNVIIQERSSSDTLYNVQLSSIEEDRDWDHRNATGFINLSSIRLNARSTQVEDFKNFKDKKSAAMF